MGLTSDSRQQSSTVGDQSARSDRSIAGGKESLDPHDLAGFLAPDFGWRNEVYKIMLADLATLHESTDFLWCGSNFSGVEVCSDDITHSHAIPVTCHKRYCPTCARRESARLVAAHTPQIMHIVKSSENKNYRLRRIDLTTRINLYDPDAKEKTKLAIAAVNKLFDIFCGMKLPEKSKHRWSEGNSQYCTGEGVTFSLEFGPHGNYLHFHCLFFGRYIVKDDLTQIWRSLTGDYITHVQSVSKTEPAIREALKYVTKMTNPVTDPATGEIQVTLPEPRFIARIAEVLRGSRRVFARGCFRGIEDDITEPGSDLGEHICAKCGSGAELVTLTLWALAFYPKYRAAQCQLDLTPGNKIAKVEETAQVANSPPVPQFGVLLTDQAIEDKSAILRAKRKFQNDDLFEVKR